MYVARLQEIPYLIGTGSTPEKSIRELEINKRLKFETDIELGLLIPEPSEYSGQFHLESVLITRITGQISRNRKYQPQPVHHLIFWHKKWELKKAVRIKLIKYYQKDKSHIIHSCE